VTAQAKPKRLGCTEPRIWTKPLVELTPETSYGFAVVRFAEEVLEYRLLPWQKWLLIHMLELDASGRFRFRTIVILVARQNGKTELLKLVTLWFMFAMGVGMVIGTAQNLIVAEKVWASTVELAQSVPDLNEEIARVDRGSGRKAMKLRTGEEYQVAAASRRGGRGFTGDLILLDELREHQSWDSWSAVTKTTLARAMALVVCLSNAGDVRSIVLRHLRRIAIEALVEQGAAELEAELKAFADQGIDLGEALGVDLAEAGDDDEFDPDDIEPDSLGLFEWSAPPNLSPRNRDGWAMANPSMGYTDEYGIGIEERAIAAALRTDPDWVFRMEVLCQWSSGSAEGPFPPGAWESCLDETSSIAEATDRKVGIDVSANHSYTYIGVAALNQHGIPHVEVAAFRAGSDWVIPWLQERGITEVALQGRGAPVSGLKRELEDAGITVTAWEGSELAAGTGKFYSYVRDGKLRHLVQPVVDVAAATAATKPLGDGAWGWDRNHSPTDIAGLVAETAAFWLLLSAPQPQVSAYDTGDLLIV